MTTLQKWQKCVQFGLNSYCHKVAQSATNRSFWSPCLYDKWNNDHKNVSERNTKAIQLNLKKYFEEKAPEMFGQIALAFWHLFFGLWYYTLSKTLSSLVERIVVEGRRSYSCPIWSLCSEGSLIALKTA